MPSPTIVLALQSLEPSLHDIQRHRHIHTHEPSGRTTDESVTGREVLQFEVSDAEFLQFVIDHEAGGLVRTLSHHSRKHTLVDPSKAFLCDDSSDSVDQTAIPRFLPVLIVDEFRFDSLHLGDEGRIER